MVDTIKFSQMASGGDLAPNEKTAGLFLGANVLFNNAFPLFPPGTTTDRPDPDPIMYYRLRFNTTLQAYEYYSPTVIDWVQLASSTPVLSAPFITYDTDASTPNAFSLGSLTSGILKQTVVGTSSTPSIANQGVDYWAPGNQITLPGNPVQPLEAATKDYVDSVATGLNIQPACVGGTTANLAGYTYDNGASGVGATLTAGSNGAFTTDGFIPEVDSRILVAQQTTPSQNGIYVLTTEGDVSTPAVLTRATDFDTPAEIQRGDFVIVTLGTVLGGTGWIQTNTVTTIGVDSIVFVQFGGNAANTVTITGTQTITGAKTFTAATTIDNLFITGNAIQHLADLDNQILFGTDTQSYETGGSSRMDISNSGLRLGAANARITTILTDATMASASNTNSYTGLAVKTYADTKISRVASQVFTASGTYTPTAGMVYCIIECVAGGGAGGGVIGVISTFSVGAGGGAGSYSITYSNAATIGASQVVTVGTGGAGSSTAGGNGNPSSVGSLCTTSGGSGAANGGTSGTFSGAQGATGGATGTGTVAFKGADGGISFSSGVTFATTGFGAAGPFGGAARGIVTAVTSTAGIAGGNYGSGGSGAVSVGVSNQLGGNGAPGVVIITEFLA